MLAFSKGHCGARLCSSAMMRADACHSNSNTRAHQACRSLTYSGSKQLIVQEHVHALELVTLAAGATNTPPQSQGSCLHNRHLTWR
jgi:hypothetical protein